MATENKNYVIAEYVWIDAYQTPRSKARVIHGKTSVKLEDLPIWNYDGSSTGQAPGQDSEVLIKPCAVFHDPFRGGNDVLVMCDTYSAKGEPIKTNTRLAAKVTFDKDPSQVPWFGIEQEYTLFKNGHPLGWPTSTARTFGGPTTQLGFPGPQGPYYCAAGADVSFGREIIEEHMFKCLDAGINLSGTNAEVLPGQWEFQVGPCVGIDSGDQMWMARYILLRVCEKYGVVPSFEPKPIMGDWNGSGCHTNFSTKAMREQDNSLDKVIVPMMKKLEARHKEHIANYGTGNEKRLTGKHETASMEKFSYGVANRGASVRIPNATAKSKKGYFEDRRPASNMDPYVVTNLIFETCCLLDNNLKPRKSILNITSLPRLILEGIPRLSFGGGKTPRLSSGSMKLLANAPAPTESPDTLKSYDGLRSPEEYASAKFFGRSRLRTSFYKHENTPIVMSLTKSKDSAFKKHAITLNKLLLSWTGEAKYTKTPEEGAIQFLADVAKANDAHINDEVYCQLMKHLTENPSADSRKKAWELLALSAKSIAPSSELEQVLSKFIHKSIGETSPRTEQYLINTIKETRNLSSPSPTPKTKVELDQEIGQFYGQTIA